MRKICIKMILLVSLLAVLSGCAYAANLVNNPSSFDTEIDTYTPLSDNIDYVMAAHINNPLSAIINIENVLGTGLKGTQATLSARLNQMLSGTGAIKSGTSFPTTPTPVDGQLYWRNDLKALYIYDGTTAQWQQLQVPSTFNFSSPSAFTLTLYHNITAGRTITFPDITDTLTTLTATQTLTNKTIDDANNTLTIFETSIADGTLLARLAANETVTGQWTFNNNIGIGMTPIYPLDITTSGAGAPIARLKNTNANGNGLLIQNGNDSNYSLNILNAAGTVSNIQLYGNGNAFLNGNIGIGTTPYTNARISVDSQISSSNWAFLTSERSAANSYNNVFLGGSIRYDGSGNYTVRGDGGSNYWAAIKMDNSGSNGGEIKFYGRGTISGVDYALTEAQLALYLKMTLGNAGLTLPGQLISTVATGTAPFSITSTTLNTNLNADMVDGYNPGNGNNNIPISNTTLNTNLNADMVDGKHYTDLAANYKARAYTVIAQTIASATWTKVIYGSEDYDPATMHSTGTGCISIPEAGYYLITASGDFFPNVTGVRQMRIVYGTACGTALTTYAYAYELNNGSTYGTYLQLSTVAYLSPAFNFVWIEVAQDSGNNLNFFSSSGGANVLTITRLDKIPQ